MHSSSPASPSGGLCDVAPLLRSKPFSACRPALETTLAAQSDRMRVLTMTLGLGTQLLACSGLYDTQRGECRV
jgi:hypothetical protein